MIYCTCSNVSKAPAYDAENIQMLANSPEQSRKQTKKPERPAERKTTARSPCLSIYVQHKLLKHDGHRI